jgi:hypothetical protein
VLRHVVVPALAILILLPPLLIKDGLLWPIPPYPFNLVLYLQAKRPEDLSRAGRIVVDDDLSGSAVLQGQEPPA